MLKKSGTEVTSRNKYWLALFLVAGVLGGVYYLRQSYCCEPAAVILSPALEVKRQSPSPKPPAVVSYQPFIPSLTEVFQNDHLWVATLSAERVRVLVATGDVSPARSVNFQAIQRRDFTWPFVKTADVLQAADLTLINLESPLTKDCSQTNEGMIFCGDERHLEGLTFAGVDLANLANNHLGNYGKAGVDNTHSLLATAGILATGLAGPVYQDVRGLKFAFLGYNDIGYPEPGIAWADQELVVKEVGQANQQADVVVVSFHWGVEYVTQPTVRQRDLAFAAIDAGADLVIGNHPHWIQPLEFYKEKAIVYAHGNFIFDQMWSLKTRQGVVGRYTFFDDALVDIEFLPVEIVDYGQPRFLAGEEKRAVLEEMKQISARPGFAEKSER